MQWFLTIDVIDVISFRNNQSYVTPRKIYKVIFTKTVLWKSEYRIYCKKIYSYVIICSFQISAIILQNWNISSSDTLKLKNVLTIDISKH